MPYNICALNYKEWEKYNLENYCDFSEKLTEYDMRTIGDSVKGCWYYIPEGQTIIHFGEWGEYNSPGASSYTWANIYDEDETEDFLKHKKELEDSEKWLKDE